MTETTKSWLKTHIDAVLWILGLLGLGFFTVLVYWYVRKSGKKAEAATK
jgi:hypothetical protein